MIFIINSYFWLFFDSFSSTLLFLELWQIVKWFGQNSSNRQKIWPNFWRIGKFFLFHQIFIKHMEKIELSKIFGQNNIFLPKKWIQSKLLKNLMIWQFDHLIKSFVTAVVISLTFPLVSSILLIFRQGLTFLQFLNFFFADYSHLSTLFIPFAHFWKFCPLPALFHTVYSLFNIFSLFTLFIHFWQLSTTFNFFGSFMWKRRIDDEMRDNNSFIIDLSMRTTVFSWKFSTFHLITFIWEKCFLSVDSRQKKCYIWKSSKMKKKLKNDKFGPFIKIWPLFSPPNCSRFFCSFYVN